jgi:IMP cyclohydrolase
MAIPRDTIKHPTDFIRAHLNEATKEYIVYDGTSRMTEVYVATVDAEDGEPCLKTTYEYDGVSTRIVKRKEELDLWDSSWDI